MAHKPLRLPLVTNYTYLDVAIICNTKYNVTKACAYGQPPCHAKLHHQWQGCSILPGKSGLQVVMTQLCLTILHVCDVKELLRSYILAETSSLQDLGHPSQDLASLVLLDRRCICV